MDETTRQINKIKKKITQLPERVARTNLLEQMALQGEATIRRRTRNGYGISGWLGDLVRLYIKPTTVKVRKYLDEKGKLSGKTSPQLANLTRTGHMLDKMHIKKGPGKSFEMRPDNADIKKAVELEEMGIKWFGFTRDEYTRLKSLALKVVKYEIRKLFKF